MLQTTPPEEIGFHTSFNKANAKKVTSLYPAKEIRRNLELLYVRVQKHFGADSSLVQVIWRAVQEQFLRESTMMTEAILKIYPNSDIQLSYSVNDALSYFTEIAKLS